LARDGQINIRLSKAEKKKIEEYVEETHEFGSVAQMVRQLCHREIKNNSPSGGIDPDRLRLIVGETIDPLAEKVAEIDEQLVELSANVSDDDEIDKLARQIFHNLPIHNHPEEFHSPVESFHIADAEEYLPSAQLASTPSAWAAYFDEDVTKVRRACATMMDAYPDAEYYEEEFDHPDGYVQQAPERRYYKTN